MPFSGPAAAEMPCGRSWFGVSKRPWGWSLNHDSATMTIVEEINFFVLAFFFCSTLILYTSAGRICDLNTSAGAKVLEHLGGRLFCTPRRSISALDGVELMPELVKKRSLALVVR